MASKSTSGHGSADTIRVKRVKRANAWVTTTIENGKQMQVWSETQPEHVEKASEWA